MNAIFELTNSIIKEKLAITEMEDEVHNKERALLEAIVKSGELQYVSINYARICRSAQMPPLRQRRIDKINRR